MKITFLKQTVLAVTIILTTLTSCDTKEKKKEFEIIGTVDASLGIDSIFIYQEKAYAQGDVLAKAAVVDGKIALKGSIDTIQKVFIGNFDKRVQEEMILENEKYNIQLDSTFFTIKGGKSHDKVMGYKSDEKYIEIFKNFVKKSEEIFKGVSMDDEERLNEARRLLDIEYKKVFTFKDQYLEKVISDEKATSLEKFLALVNSSDREKYPFEKRKELIASYEKDLANQINFKIYKRYIEDEETSMKKKSSVENGKPYKEILGLDKDGKEIKLSDLVKENEYTLLEFWASWCSPCRAEIPNLKKAYTKYKKDGLEIISVSIDKKKDDWLAALKEEGSTWPNIIVEGANNNPMVLSYGVDGVPASYLISKEGIIVANNRELREFELERTLSKIFNKK